jgi:hypothetical protein
MLFQIFICRQKISVLQRLRSGAAFAISYRLTARRVTNEDIFIETYSLLEMLLTYCCQQIRIVLILIVSAFVELLSYYLLKIKLLIYEVIISSLYSTIKFYEARTKRIGYLGGELRKPDLYSI